MLYGVRDDIPASVKKKQKQLIIIIMTIIIIIIIIIIYRTFIAPMLEFRALYSCVNSKNKIKMTKTTN